MFEFLARFFRVLWRQETEGTGGSAVILDFPAAPALMTQDQGIPASAPVAFIRRSAEAKSGAVTSPATSSRQLPALLHSVSRLNSPSSRTRSTAAVARANKPIPVAAPAALKRTATVKPGVVIGRIAPAQKRPTAAIVDLADVRADLQRNRQVEMVDREIVALFN